MKTVYVVLVTLNSQHESHSQTFAAGAYPTLWQAINAIVEVDKLIDSFVSSDIDNAIGNKAIVDKMWDEYFFDIVGAAVEYGYGGPRPYSDVEAIAVAQQLAAESLEFDVYVNAAVLLD